MSFKFSRRTLKPDGDSVAEAVTGVQFPRQQQYWHGGMLTCLGAGPRVKKVGFLSVKAYAVAMYVDAEAAAAADRSEKQPESEAAALDVLSNGAFEKVLHINLVRSITGKQFSDALDEALRPLMRGDEALLDDFCAFFTSRKLEKGTEVILLRRKDGPLDLCVKEPNDNAPWTSAQPSLTVSSPRLGHAIWDVYLSPKLAPSPEGRKAWLGAVHFLAAGTSTS